MHVGSPIWLIGLAPWMAVAVWMLCGSSQRVRVPFLSLWRKTGASPRAARRLHTPPAAIAFALISLLLSIFAAAHPQLATPHRQARQPITIVLDHGFTMSARGAADLRYREVAGQVYDGLRERFQGCTIQLVAVPGNGSESLGLDEFLARVKRLPPTAVDTRQLLSDVLSQSKPPALVLSDQAVRTLAKWIQIAPEQRCQDVGITALAAREGAVPQVMVRIRNQSAQASVLLRVSSGPDTIERQLDLPSEPGERNYFFDLARLGSEVTAELLSDDDLPADDRAWLVREGANAHIEPRFPLLPELQRLVDAYEKSRPAGDSTVQLPVVREASELSQTTPGVVVANAPQMVAEMETRQTLDHPITRHVDWPKLRVPLRVAEAAPAGWTPLVRDAEHVLVAVRPTPPNQVWIGFDAPQWATFADYVIFWTNIFDWAGGGGESFKGHGLGEWTSQWEPVERHSPSQAGNWPGLYRRVDGLARAFNAPDVPLAAPPQTNWRAEIAALAAESARTDIAPWLLIGAVACLLLAALLWKRSIARPSPSPAAPPAPESPSR